MNASDLRRHASQCRTLSASMPSGICKDVLIEAARDYEHRADRLDILVRMPVAARLGLGTSRMAMSAV